MLFPLPLTLLAPVALITGPKRAFRHKVMLLACGMNLPPDPKGACWGLAHQPAGMVRVETVVAKWEEAMLYCTIWVTHAGSADTRTNTQKTSVFVPGIIHLLHLFQAVFFQ